MFAIFRLAQPTRAEPLRQRGDGRRLPLRPFRQLQEESEKVLRSLAGPAARSERWALLRSLRELIYEADQLLLSVQQEEMLEEWKRQAEFPAPEI